MSEETIQEETIQIDIKTAAVIAHLQSELTALRSECEQLKEELESFKDEVDSPEDIKELKRVISLYQGIAIENNRLKADKRELVEATLEDLKMNIISDRDTVLKNFPSASKGYSRCLMLLDEAVAKHREV